MELQFLGDFSDASAGLFDRSSVAHPVPHLHYDGDTADGDVATLQGMYYPAILEPRTDTSVSPIEG